ncbi:hypothetical protein BST95_14685 [Halioglobus japonicus]|uniref:DUF5666 domain-containing protein n=1 Tax=Halioglobus japonicus TaxID=930805 RepID=A0AAP8MGX2_9GAMM|nr:hypothetical protein [Halioglobus japonicus]AQA19304.1 hypothetical protein BST95_14685 [Halioglobus japonicus]PLW87653.1 hypothetical protein C0029_03500 [Halioglobus japonicus]GHD07287.1 hypothetical protein GCM10007052_02940 [Halioglobus japonicus]
MRRILFPLGLSAILVTPVSLADTIELADGTLLEGTFVGMSNGIMMFDTGAGIEAFPEDEVVAIFNSEGVAAREAAQEAVPAPKAEPAPPPPPKTATVASGTRLVIRMSEAIDTRRHSSGHRFRAQLESALMVDGVTVAPRGTMLYGRITQAKSAGRVAGSSEMAIEFTDIMLNELMYEITTDGLKAQTGNEAGRTAKRTARAAALGGLYGGSSSAKKGAKVGVGASILTSGASINIPAGTLVETNLRAPLTVKL